MVKRKKSRKTTPRSVRRATYPWWVILSGVSLAIGFIVWLFGTLTVPSKPTSSTAARAFQTGDYKAALAACESLLKDQPGNSRYLMMAGESASRLGDFQAAVDFYEAISDDDRAAATARWAAGEVVLHQRHMTHAIQLMERSLQLDPTQSKARERLIYLLNLSGRRWDAVPHLFALLRQDQWSVQHLLYLGNTAKPIENEVELNEFLTGDPSDKLPLLGVAKIRWRVGNTDEAKALLESVCEQFPALVEAKLQLGNIWLQTQADLLPAWEKALPIAAAEHPDTWMIRGQWARTAGKLKLATSCFATAVRIEPNHIAALNGLSQTLHALGQDQLAQPFTARAEKLEKFVYTLERIMSDEWTLRRGQTDGNSPTSRPSQQLNNIVTAAQLTFELGRSWESHAWTQYGLAMDAGNQQLQAIDRQLRAALNPQTPRTQAAISDDNWLQSLDLPAWPDGIQLPESSSLANTSAGSNSTVAPIAGLRFVDFPKALDFQYFAARDSHSDGRRMFEFTGGGVGVLDYDLNGWPDVFLAQGCSWPFDGSDQTHSDQLRRNLGVANDQLALENVTTPARISESAFGQGVTVGDVNSDGFDDVYVCNFGSNQLWLNQGDGTFQDGTAHFAQLASSWTASAAIADLNGDGLAEIYDANYVQGDDVATRRCPIGGLPRACAPLNFQPARGRLWAADDNGVFQEVSRAVISPEVREGNALGLVVFRLRGQKLPAIFVANDQVANVMLRAKDDPSSPLGIRLEDQAILMGLAFDGQGRAQACMGVATEDFNGDGNLDLFVTNYYDESNTLYAQLDHESFADISASSGIVAPSLKLLGFGTQAIDATLDGSADLLVLNGHIDDMTHQGIPYRMPTQFFSNDGQARFTATPPQELGEYFQHDRLGRALVCLDIDRDGRQDFIATELDGPTHLVRNFSDAGTFLSLRLVGTQTHRDAIGTEAMISLGDRLITKQLTAGCGYMCSNERTLHFGCGTAAEIDRLVIRWPSGAEQTFQGVSTNQHWLVIEGNAQLVPLP